MSTLTLPGIIPNLLRRGSPVTLRPRVYGEVTLMHGGQGVVHDAARGVAVVDTFGGSPRVVRYGREDVALDLADPTGRAHAAWWLVAGRAWSELEDIVERLTGNCDLGAWLDWFTMPDQSVSQEMIAELRLVCLHVAGLPS